MRKPHTFAIVIALLILAASLAVTKRVDGQLTMEIESTAFKAGEPIPRAYTCQGDNVNPALRISDLPAGTKSLALIVDDPDAPMGTWVHWVVYNIPAQSEILENSVPGTQGQNSWGTFEYGGPCPPSGTHRYYFKVYALDEALDLKQGLSKMELQAAIKSHIMNQAELTGLYEKS